MYQFPDPKTTDPKEYRVQRFFEMLPALLTWGTFLGLIVLSWILPFLVAIFILIYNLYWLFKAFYLSAHLVVAHRKMAREKNMDWFSKAKKVSGYDEIYHVIMFLTYDEAKEVLEQSIKSIENSLIDKNKLIVVVATEEREGQAREEKEIYLKDKFAKTFHSLIVTKHPDGIDGEMKAKGANATYAAKQVKLYLEQNSISQEEVIISIFDSDTLAHPQYLAALTHSFLKAEEPHRRSYQPLPMYHNNIWDAPAVTRVVAMNSTFWHMMESVRYDRMVTFSSHSMSFKTLVDVNYWPTNIVSDDSIIYWKCLDYFNGEYGVEPIHVPVSLDAVQADSLWQTFLNQYKQMRRWAYGIEDLALVMRSYARNPKAALGPKIRRISNMIIGHYTWATSAIILAFYVWFPIWLGSGQFQETVLSNNLPNYVSTLMTITLSGLLITAYLNQILLPPKPKNYSMKRSFMMTIQWLLVPVIALVFGSFPAIEAQTRLFLGKYLGFWVTPKVRKEQAFFSDE